MLILAEILKKNFLIKILYKLMGDGPINVKT